MAFNMFRLRKYAAILLCGCLPAVLLTVGSLYYNLVPGGIIFFVIGLLLIIPIGILFMKNPFTDMVEGKGLLALNLDSTGVITPFVVNVAQPFMGGRMGKTSVKSIFDRKAVMHMAAPKNAKTAAVPRDDGGIVIDIGQKELNEGRFALFHYPVILYNAQLSTVITKDWFSDIEKTAFAEHSILYMNRLVEDLSSHVRDFGRYIVEQLKPGKSGILNKWWVWVLVIVLVGLILLMFAPGIIDSIKGFSGTTTAAVQSAAGSGAAVVPR